MAAAASLHLNCVLSLWSHCYPEAVLSPHRCSREGFPVFLMRLRDCQGHMFLESLHRAQLSKHRCGTGILGTWAYADGAVGGLDIHTFAPQETLLIVGEL